MNARLLTTVIAAAIFPLQAHAHDCSGGTEGGMDATGNQCNADTLATPGPPDPVMRPSKHVKTIAAKKTIACNQPQSEAPRRERCIQPAARQAELSGARTSRAR
jgi:hypothetical protein